MQHEGSFHLDDIRHIQDDEALRTVLGLKKLPKATTLGDWLRRMGSQPQIQDAWVAMYTVRLPPIEMGKAIAKSFTGTTSVRKTARTASRN